MFLKALNCPGEVKDKDFITKHMRDIIMDVRASNVVQIVTDNAAVCKAVGLLTEAEFPSICWTPCDVHTLNLALKNICSPKNTRKKKSDTYQQCVGSQIAKDASYIKNFIMGHSMRLSMFSNINSLKLLFVASTRFSSTIVMLTFEQ